MSSIFHKGKNLKKEIDLYDSEFFLLRDFIYEKTGIFIRDNKKYLLKNRLINRIKDLNLNSFEEYYYFLKYDPNKKQELNHLYSVVSTNETCFFRNYPQIEIYRKNIVPEILQKKRKNYQNKLRIWSAGCSTGEEPYTLIMILCEILGSEINKWNIKISANDLSSNVIKSAERGIYTSYTLRNTPQYYLDKYFTEERQGIYKIDPELKKYISFSTLNLKENSQISQIEQSDIIFCRNVIIYFNDEMKRKVINAFYDKLYPGGYLFIGHSESLHNISRAFKPNYYPGTIVYKKED